MHLHKVLVHVHASAQVADLFASDADVHAQSSSAHPQGADSCANGAHTRVKSVLVAEAWTRCADAFSEVLTYMCKCAGKFVGGIYTFVWLGFIHLQDRY